MVPCVVHNINFLKVMTPSKRIATDIFGGNFGSFKDKIIEEVDSEFKTYYDLTQHQGHIRIFPCTKRRIKAYFQWTCGNIRLRRNPSTTGYHVGYRDNLLRYFKTHKLFVKKSKTIAEADKPISFKKYTKWVDW